MGSSNEIVECRSWMRFLWKRPSGKVVGPTQFTGRRNEGNVGRVINETRLVYHDIDEEIRRQGNTSFGSPKMNKDLRITQPFFLLFVTNLLFYL